MIQPFVTFFDPAAAHLLTYDAIAYVLHRTNKVNTHASENHFITKIKS